MDEMGAKARCAMSAQIYLGAAELAGIHVAILCIDTEVIARIHIAPAGGVVEACVRIVRIPATTEWVNIQMFRYLYGHINLLNTGDGPPAGLPARFAMV